MTKVKYKKIDLILSLICVILTVFRITLDIVVPVFIQADAIYDDRLLFNYAYSLSKFQWLGSFSQLTLAKTLGYSLFVVAAHYVHIPLSLATLLYYIGSVIILIFSLKKIISNKYFLYILYIILIFCPISFGVGAFKVVYRNGVQISTMIMVIASTIGVFKSRGTKNKLIFWTVLDSIFITFFYLVKEDGIWLMPFAIGGLIITFIYLFIENNKKINKKCLLLLIPILSLVIVLTGYKFINYKVYGEYTLTDRTGTNFHLVINDIMSVKSSHTKYSWVTKDTIYKVVNNSKTLYKYKDIIYDNMYEGWGMTKDGEIWADLFYWRLRHCISLTGLYDKGGKEVNDFYGKVHKELNKAFKDGRLKKDENSYHISSSLPNYNKNEIEQMKKLYLPMLKKIYSYSNALNDIGLYNSTGDYENIEFVRSFTRDKIYDGKNKEKWAINIEKRIIGVYQDCGLIFGIIGLIGNIIFYIFSINQFFKKNFNSLEQFLIQIGLFGTFILYYFIIVWFGLKFPDNVGIIYGYMHPAHIILNILTLVGIYNIIYVIKKIKVGDMYEKRKSIK